MCELTCIICPVGCSLAVEEGPAALTISGNRCPRGVEYAREELHAPRRTVTATCGIAAMDAAAASGAAFPRDLNAPRRIPVKTSEPCPKERIGELLRDIYGLKPALPVKMGDTLIADWKGSGIDVVAVRTVDY